MEIWILIILLWNAGGAGVNHVEFTSKERCQAAAQALVGQFQTVVVDATCVQK